MLENLKASAAHFLSNKKFLVIVLLSCLFIGVAIYVYLNYISPKLDPTFVPNKEFVKESDIPKNADIYFFFTDWCPHSKKSKLSLLSLNIPQKNFIQSISYLIDEFIQN